MDTKVQDLRSEMKRRNTTKLNMLRMFQDSKELTTQDLNRNFGTGCSSRLHELREEGHAIVATYERPGQYRYTYLGNKAEE